jgi:hypothetical protein
MLMNNITQEELPKIVVWGTQIMKQFTKGMLNNENAIVSKKDKPDEYCFTMKTLPWDIEQSSKNLSHMWIGDTGASYHFTNDDTAFIDWTPINHVIGVGNGNLITASKIGTVRLEVQQRSGKRNIVILQGCKFAKELNNNFFSITQALAKGWQLTNRGVRITLTKINKDNISESGQIVFDTIDPGTSGIVMMVKMVPKPIPYDRGVNNIKELICNISTMQHVPIQMLPPNHYHTNYTMDFQSPHDMNHTYKLTPARNNDRNIDTNFFSNQIMKSDFSFNPTMVKDYPPKMTQHSQPS